MGNSDLKRIIRRGSRCLSGRSGSDGGEPLRDYAPKPQMLDQGVEAGIL